MDPDVEAIVRSRARRKRPLILRALGLANLVIAAGAVFGWAHVSQVLVEPFRWATWQVIPPRPALFDYPYMLLWMVPLVAAALGWVLYQAQERKAARNVLVFPVLVLAMVVGWYNLAPSHWQ